MKLLQNKSTGEIGCLICSFGKTPEKITIVQYIDGKRGSKVWYYNSLAELNEEWEDYEEPKEYWFLSGRGEVKCIEDENTDFDKDHKYIGNYFETKEEAEKAVEKLRAYKRLKDKGFRFCKYTALAYGEINFRIPDFEGWNNSEAEQVRKDLDLLFGGAEWIGYGGEE